ncbi:hypothetical protein ACEA89_27915, partial [Escherichia coli]
PEVVETTHPEVIAAAVTEQPQVITESDVAIAQEVAEPQPEVVETTHPEVIAAAVTEQPQVITESDVAIAQEV